MRFSPWENEFSSYPWYSCNVIIFQNKKDYPSFWNFSFATFTPDRVHHYLIQHFGISKLPRIGQKVCYSSSFCRLNRSCSKKGIFVETLITVRFRWQNSMSSVTLRPPCWCLSEGHQRGVYIRISINLGKTLFRITREWITWQIEIVARLFIIIFLIPAFWLNSLNVYDLYF